MKKIEYIFKWYDSNSFYIKPTRNYRDLYRFDGTLVQLLIMLNSFEQSNETSFLMFISKDQKFIKSAFVLEDTKGSRLFELVADFTNV